MPVPGEEFKRYLDVSGGEKQTVSRFLHKPNELQKARNVNLAKKIGAGTRRMGNEQVGAPVQDAKSITGLISFFHSRGYDLIAAANSSGDSSTNLRYLNYGYLWLDILTDLPTGTNVKALTIGDLDEMMLVGYSPTNGQFMSPTVIYSDKSYSRVIDVTGAPKGKFINKFADQVYIANIEVNGKRRPNTIARSSLPTKLITVTNGAQTGYLWRLQVDDVTYLRPGMRIDIYDPQSGAKVVDSLSIVTVDRQNSFITFAGQPLSVGDNFTIYLEDQKDNFRLFWNDEETLSIPSKKNEIPEIMWIEEENNRLLIWTQKSLWKWDNANLIKISDTVGLASSDSIQKLGNGWIVWADLSRNIWAYNDATGAFQKISRGMEPYFEAAKSPPSVWTSSGLDDVYTIFIGQVGTLGARLTSTSTSSTSTSSTSTSTSSTSTSSTSTSSTTTTTSTSSSTSSTSTSSTSTSTSSTSTSSTTAHSGVTYYRLRYFFNLNAWSVDTIDRPMTTSVVHTQNGLEEIYWGDQSGRVYRQDVGLSDFGSSIPMEIETVEYDQGNPETIKEYNEIYVYTKYGQSADIYLSFDGGNWIAVDQVDDGTNRIKPRDAKYKGQPFKGHYYQLKITQNDLGDAVVYEGTTAIYTQTREV